MSETRGKNHRLTVEVKDGELVVRIGIHALAHSALWSGWANPYEFEGGEYVRKFAIADPLEFAHDVRRALVDEAEDGSSLISYVLGKAMEHAVNDGSLGLHDADVRVLHGQVHACEAWAKEQP